MTGRMHKLRVVSLALVVTLAAGSGAAEPRKERFRGWTPLSGYVSAGLAEGGSFRLDVPTRRGVVEMALRPVGLAGPAYAAEEATQGGPRRGRGRPALRTFAGAPVEDAAPQPGGDFVRLARAPGGALSGLLRVDGVLYDLAADPAAGDLVLAVEEVDASALGERYGACAAVVEEALAEAADAGTAGAGDLATAAAGALREIELGTEADALFVAQTGGVAAANAKIVSIVNAINGIYEFDLGLTNTIVFQRAWNGSDPYTSSDSGTLLSEFRSDFLANVATPTDDVQLFSGRDFENNVVGRAYVSAACTSARFGVNQYYQQSESLTRLIAAHEMGHNFGGNHTADGIMAASINPSVTWFGATSQTQIGSYVNGVSCLAEVPGGGPPELAPIGPRDAPEGEPLEIQLSATDPDDDPISWSALPLPVGATLSNDGLFAWEPALDAVGCGGFVDVSVTFTAIDTDGNQASETVVIHVLDSPSGSAPDFADPADRSVPAGQTVAIPLAASDPDGDSITFSAASLPAGATLSPAGSFVWTPSDAQLGLHALVFTAEDCTGATASREVGVEVVSSAPHLAALSAASGAKGDELEITGTNLAGRKVHVWFGGKKAKAYEVGPGSLRVKVPKKKKDAPDATLVTVMRDQVASDNALPFTYQP